MRFNKKPDEAGAKEAFRVLLASSHTGSERYVEWKKAA
jgi:hypothetical protein